MIETPLYDIIDGLEKIMTVALNIDGSNPNQIVEFQIEGVVFYFHVVWNYRMGWSVSIYDADNNPSTDIDSRTPLLAGLKVMPNGLLTWRYSRESGLFEGDVLALDTEAGINGTITRDNFGEGRRFVPTYFTKDELDSSGIEYFTSYRR
ncbi:MAG: hypothetical protein GY861_11690 [bacterium]|nr:hypothetical protein [bacterium]